MRHSVNYTFRVVTLKIGSKFTFGPSSSKYKCFNQCSLAYGAEQSRKFPHTEGCEHGNVKAFTAVCISNLDDSLCSENNFLKTFDLATIKIMIDFAQMRIVSDAVGGSLINKYLP